MKVKSIGHGLDHVNVLVKDLEAAMSFFSDVFGSKFIGPIDHRPHGFPLRVAFDNVGFALQSPTSPDSPLARQIDEHGEVLPEVVVLVLGDAAEDLGELVAGKKPGRETAAERTMACNLGLAIDDVALAISIYKQATKKEIGTWLPL